MLEKYLFKRGNTYQYRRRTPKFITHLDTREKIVISLKTTNKTQALLKAQIYNDHIENYWRALAQSGTAAGNKEKYKAAVRLALTHGFVYKTATQIADSQLQEILQRVSTELKTSQDEQAVLGGVEIPTITIEEGKDEYFELVADRLVNKNDYQKRKWKNPRLAAIKNFIAITGNKPVAHINRTDTLAFKNWCKEKIVSGWNSGTANKQITQVKNILNVLTIEYQLQLDIEQLFKDTKFKRNTNSRLPYEAEYVQNNLLKGLDKLNHKDSMVLYAMADTGARNSEIFGLLPDDIFLNEEIPYIWIRPHEGHALKTNTSERKIPLVGTALYAFQQYPEGFKTKGNPDTFSAGVNKYLKTHKLKPTPKHSIYSLRHTFKDRLRDAEAPEEIIDGLMGHKKSGPKYGRGHKLETLHKWLNKIAYSVPEKG